MYNEDEFNIDDNYKTFEETIFNIPGEKNTDKLHAMTAIEKTMRTSGWFDKCEDGLPKIESFKPIQPSIIQSGKLWQAAISEKIKIYQIHL
jgi:hypothetical protein